MRRTRKHGGVDEKRLQEVDDNWIWGNHRGGGGAPLMDNSGNQIANLKGVLAGAIAVDHSSPKKGDGRGRRDGEFGFREDPHNDGDFRQPRDGRNGVPNGRRARFVDEKEDRRVIPGLSDIAAGNENDAVQRRNMQESPRGQPFQASGRQMNGNRRPFEDHQSPEKQRQRPFSREEQQQQGAPHHSPGKRMNALREITSGMSNSERDQKLRKQQQYQALLQQQIEEKRHAKEKEKRELEAIKQRELEEYYASQNMQPPPQRARAAMNSPPVGRQSSFEEEPRHERGNPMLNRSQESTDSSPGKRMKRKSNRTGGQPVEDGAKFVTVEEYNKLSRLCDRLLNQQDELQEEIRRQAETIQDLKFGRPQQQPKGRRSNADYMPSENDDEAHDYFDDRNSQVEDRGAMGNSGRFLQERGNRGSLPAPIGRSKSMEPSRVNEFGRPSDLGLDVNGVVSGGSSFDELDDEDNYRQQKKQLRSPRRRPSSMHAIGAKNKDLLLADDRRTNLMSSREAEDAHSVGQSEKKSTVRGKQQGKTGLKGAAGAVAVVTAAKKPRKSVGFGSSVAKPRADGRDVAAGRPPVAPRGSSKVAESRAQQAGSNIIGSAASNRRNKSGIGGAGAKKPVPVVPEPAAQRHQNKGSDAPAGGMGGFARLQQKAERGLRVVATHETEAEDRGGRGMLAQQSLELRGQSEYLRVSDTDELGGDQLDKLLTNARNAR